MHRNLVFSLFLAAVLAVSCTQTARMESGPYTMTLMPVSGAATLPSKTVQVTVEDDRVTIQNPDSERVLEGELQKNQLLVSSRQDNETIEFKGIVSADSRIQGNVVHTRDGQPVYRAAFVLTPEPTTDQEP